MADRRPLYRDLVTGQSTEFNVPIDDATPSSNGALLIWDSVSGAYIPGSSLVLSTAGTPAKSALLITADNSQTAVTMDVNCGNSTLTPDSSVTFRGSGLGAWWAGPTVDAFLGPALVEFNVESAFVGVGSNPATHIILTNQMQGPATTAAAGIIFGDDGTLLLIQQDAAGNNGSINISNGTASFGATLASAGNSCNVIADATLSVEGDFYPDDGQPTNLGTSSAPWGSLILNTATFPAKTALSITGDPAQTAVLADFDGGSSTLTSPTATATFRGNALGTWWGTAGVSAGPSLAEFNNESYAAGTNIVLSNQVSGGAAVAGTGLQANDDGTFLLFQLDTAGDFGAFYTNTGGVWSWQIGNPTQGVGVNLDSSLSVEGDFYSQSGLTNLGLVSNPWGNLYIAGTGTNPFLITGVASAGRIVTLPDADSNTVQPEASAPSGEFVQYIDSNGVQHFATPSGGGGGTPGGSDTNIQYNKAVGSPAANTFAGDSNFTWDYADQILKVSGQSVLTFNSPPGEDPPNAILLLRDTAATDTVGAYTLTGEATLVLTDSFTDSVFITAQNHQAGFSASDDGGDSAEAFCSSTGPVAAFQVNDIVGNVASMNVSFSMPSVTVEDVAGGEVNLTTNGDGTASATLSQAGTATILLNSDTGTNTALIINSDNPDVPAFILQDGVGAETIQMGVNTTSHEAFFSMNDVVGDNFAVFMNTGFAGLALGDDASDSVEIGVSDPGAGGPAATITASDASGNTTNLGVAGGIPGLDILDVSAGEVNLSANSGNATGTWTQAGVDTVLINSDTTTGAGLTINANNASSPALTVQDTAGDMASIGVSTDQVLFSVGTSEGDGAFLGGFGPLNGGPAGVLQAFDSLGGEVNFVAQGGIPTLTLTNSTPADVIILDGTGTGSVTSGVFVATDSTPTVGAGQLGIGTTNGVGNGAPIAVLAPALGTGSGPAAPQAVVGYLKVNIGGTDFWMALFQ